MTRLEAALLDLASFLDDRQVPYMVIGGFANLHWGAERFTRDLDITVEVPEEKLDDLIHALRSRFTMTVPDPGTFARRNHLVRVQSAAGVDVDLILAAIPYEIGAIRRAKAVEIGSRSVRICTPEDLIIHKLASERAQDRVDVQHIVARQTGKLDLDYLWPKVRDLATGLERPGIVDYLAQLLRDGGREAAGDPLG